MKKSYLWHYRPKSEPKTYINIPRTRSENRIPWLASLGIQPTSLQTPCIVYSNVQRKIFRSNSYLRYLQNMFFLLRIKRIFLFAYIFCCSRCTILPAEKWRVYANILKRNLWIWMQFMDGKMTQNKNTFDLTTNEAELNGCRAKWYATGRSKCLVPIFFLFAPFSTAQNILFMCMSDMVCSRYVGIIAHASWKIRIVRYVLTPHFHILHNAYRLYLTYSKSGIFWNFPRIHRYTYYDVKWNVYNIVDICRVETKTCPSLIKSTHSLKGACGSLLIWRKKHLP